MNKSKVEKRLRALVRSVRAPELERVIPELPAELLHRMIQVRGLDDCADLLPLVTHEQLAQIFDLDLWRAASAGGEERFDPERFGAWMEVLADAGPAVAAEKLAGLDLDVVIAGFAGHTRVFDQATVREYTMLDGTPVSALLPDHLITAELAGYILSARRTDSWDAIVFVLTALGDHYPSRFHEVMAGCRALSNAGHEVDGLDALLDERGQARYDAAIDRSGRLERQGYVSVGDARVFLTMSRNVSPGSTVVSAGKALAHATRDDAGEVAFLANTLKTGCAIQGRTFTAREAWDAAEAVCSLGRETDPLAADDPIRLFQTGWTVLHDDVAMYAAAGLVDALRTRRGPDPVTRRDLDTLRVEMTRYLRAGTPWRAREAMDVLAILDQLTWVRLLGLIDECPVIVTTGGTAFELISTRAQVREIQAFVRSLDAVM
jgi:hypothetical protein